LLSRPPARGAAVLWAISARPGLYGHLLPEWTGSAMAVLMAVFGGGFLDRRLADISNRLLGPNSNSVASAGVNALGFIGYEPPPGLLVPGWGVPVAMR